MEKDDLFEPKKRKAANIHVLWPNWRHVCASFFRTFSKSLTIILIQCPHCTPRIILPLKPHLFYSLPLPSLYNPTSNRSTPFSVSSETALPTKPPPNSPQDHPRTIKDISSQSYSRSISFALCFPPLMRSKEAHPSLQSFRVSFNRPIVPNLPSPPHPLTTSPHRASPRPTLPAICHFSRTCPLHFQTATLPQNSFSGSSSSPNCANPPSKGRCSASPCSWRSPNAASKKKQQRNERVCKGWLKNFQKKVNLFRN